MPKMCALFNMIARIDYGMECAHLRLKKIFRDYSLKEAADFTERHFKLPPLRHIKSFHMPTIEARQPGEHFRLLERGRFIYRDPLREYTRIYASYNEDKEQWTVTRQKLRVYQSEMEQGIGIDKGRVEQSHFGADQGHNALNFAERLFEKEYYAPNPSGTPTDKKISRGIAGDHHPHRSIMAHIVRRIADIETTKSAGTASPMQPKPEIL